MHIPDGILPTSVCLGGYLTTGLAAWFTLRKINNREDPREGIPRTSLLTAAYMVVTWIHIPIPPASVHLLMIGLMGAILGYYAFPAILIGLFFQAVLFQHGGLTTLGVNGSVLGLSALLAYFIFRARNLLTVGGKLKLYLFGFLSGAAGTGLAALLMFTILFTTIPAHIDVTAERAGIYALTIAHIPLMVIEGIFTALVVAFLERVKPEILKM